MAPKDSLTNALLQDYQIDEHRFVFVCFFQKSETFGKKVLNCATFFVWQTILGGAPNVAQLRTFCQKFLIFEKTKFENVSQIKNFRSGLNIPESS